MQLIKINPQEIESYLQVFQNEGLSDYLQDKAGTSLLIALWETMENVLQDKKLSCLVLTELLEQFGGTQVYFPNAKHLNQEIRNHRISREFDGRNVHDLAKRYKLSYTSIYRILRRNRSISEFSSDAKLS